MNRTWPAVPVGIARQNNCLRAQTPDRMIVGGAAAHNSHHSRAAAPPVTMNSSLLSSIRGASPEMLLARLGPRLPTIATWLLGILLGVQAAIIVRDLIPQPAPVAALPASTPGDTSRRTVNVQSILNAHLFGEAAPSAADPANA